jgi:hypothetical protein
VPGTTVTASTTILSAWANGFTADVAATFNTEWPIALLPTITIAKGGTGATTAGAAADALSPAAVNVASAATTNIGAAASPNVNITGTTTITAFDTVTSGIKRWATFTGILTLTHNGTSLILPGAANITTAAGDTALFESEGGGNWRCLYYQRATGQAVVAPAGSWVTFQSGTISNQAAVDILGFPSSAKVVEIYMDSISPVTDAQNLRLRTSTDGGSTFDSGATDYRFTHLRSTVGGSIVEGGSAGTTDIVLSSGVGNAAGESVSGTVTFYDPGVVQRISMIYQVDGVDNNGAGFTVSGGGQRRANADVDAIRLFFASGNLNSGRYIARYFS